MNSQIDNILMDYASENFEQIAKVNKQLSNNKSQIIEIIGKQNSGKSLIFRKIIQKEKTGLVYIPAIFKINNFQNIIQLLTDISNEKFKELISKVQKFSFKNRFDFFYYITDKLNAENLIKPKTIFIYEKKYLDEYTSDFIHYIVENFKDKNVKFVIFTNEQTYTFSKKYFINQLQTKNIKKILKILFSKNKLSFTAESEIIMKKSGGDIFIIHHILNELKSKNIKKKISDYFDKKISAKTIVKEKLDKLPETRRKLLLQIFLLSSFASKKVLKQISNSEILIQNLEKLKKDLFIFEVNDVYYIKKNLEIMEYFQNLKEADKQKYLNSVIKYLDKNNILEFEITFFENKLENYSIIIDELLMLSDFQNLIRINEKYLNHQKNKKQKIDILLNLGIANENLHNYDMAAENLQKALKLCVESSNPADKIILHLAGSMHQAGSSAFALEIIKKYSFASKDSYLKSQILLLKAEINIEKEKFDEALKIINDISKITGEIKNSKLRSLINANSKKLKGKIFYYSDKWDKAYAAFEESEMFYEKADDKGGIAAINNNLGVLAMFRGDSKNSEKLLSKSLDFEKQRYNLNGMSVCYSNLGGLYEECGNYKKSLQSLNEALNIQKLLADKYSITNIYLNISVTYMDNGEYEKAEEALLKSLQIAVQFNLYKNVIACQNNLGALYFKSGDFAKANKYYEQAIKKSEANSFSEGLCQSYNNIGELYEKRGEFNSAYEFYTKGMKLVSKISDEFIVAELKGNLGSVLTRLHKFKDAYGYLVESFDFFKGLDAKDKIIEGSQKQAMYFILTRNYESANYYLDYSLKLAKEINNEFQIGKTYYLKAFLEKDNAQTSMNLLKKAIKYFVTTNNNFDLVLANYEYAALLSKDKDWEQAIQILKDNRKLIRKFDAINILEKNDLLIQKLEKKYSIELKESKNQELLLNKFYNITQELNDITDFDILLETALDKLIDFSEADGGLFALNHNSKVKDSWDYLICNNFSEQNKHYSKFINIIEITYKNNEGENSKQPQFAPEYNNIISFPLVVRNEIKGVICLFSKLGSHYFTEKMVNIINALCNQIIVIVENISFKKLQASHNIIREELESLQSFPNIIGKSKKLQDIFRMIEKIKDSPTTILLEGDSGTGKELIARAIHFNSNRKNRKFVAQYCGALSETLLESELFGHVKGSFTGATHDKKGLFEVADGGTFFLDEIADISPSIQAKLLRFLQEGEIKPVGSTQIQKVNVRVICATNVSLKEKVDSGDFRLDLFYRLNVIKIDVPSLSERKSDIPLLTVHFLDKYTKIMNKKISGITDEAMKYLINYSWPGNIRQLENEIERAVTLSERKTSIQPSDFSEDILHFQEYKDTLNLLEKKVVKLKKIEEEEELIQTNSLKDAVENLEKEMIIEILTENEWNQTQASKELGLSRQGLIKKMHRYNISKNI